MVVYCCENQKCTNNIGYTKNPSEKKYKDRIVVKEILDNILDMPDNGKCPVCNHFLKPRTINVKEINTVHSTKNSTCKDDVKDGGFSNSLDLSNSSVMSVRRLGQYSNDYINVESIQSEDDDSKSAPLSGEISGKYEQVNNIKETKKIRRIRNKSESVIDNLTEEMNNTIELIVNNCFEKHNVIGMNATKIHLSNLYHVLNNENMKEMQGNSSLNDTTIRRKHFLIEGDFATGKSLLSEVVIDLLRDLGIRKEETKYISFVEFQAAITSQKKDDMEEIFKECNDSVIVFDDNIDELFMQQDGSVSIDYPTTKLLLDLAKKYAGICTLIITGSVECCEGISKLLKNGNKFFEKLRIPNYSVEESFRIVENVLRKTDAVELNVEASKYIREQLADEHFTEDYSLGHYISNLVELSRKRHSDRMALLEKSGKNFNQERYIYILDDVREKDDEKELHKFDIEEKLQTIIGLDSVKEFLRVQYKLRVADEKRKKAGKNVDTTQSLNMIFLGNPGTGKTTIARFVAEMFKSMGVLKKGHLVETKRSDFVAEYEGQTATKTEKIFKSALGGVLFIDEAYSLSKGNGDLFGEEAIDTLVKLIEDYSGQIAVILAGYSHEMNEFIKLNNTGIVSRFPKELRIEFPDYSEGELFLICKKMISDRGFILEHNTDEIIKDEIRLLKSHANMSSGNGRMIRNYVDEVIRRQSVRCVEQNILADELVVVRSMDLKKEKVHLINRDDLEKEFSSIVGLESVKEYFRNLVDFLEIQNERKSLGLKAEPTQSLHMIFRGNPGTGKTTIARIVAKLLFGIGVISSDKLIEVDSEALVAGYVGQTAEKTGKVIESAIGGVLFIDEVYELANESENGFGQDAIDILNKRMEDYRDQLVVIIAGYDEKIEGFLEKNLGLASRFNRDILFPNYSVEELLQIAENLYTANDYILNDNAKKVLREKFENARKEKNFGNGRYVRRIYELSLINHGCRVKKEQVRTKEALTTITGEDVDI